MPLPPVIFEDAAVIALNKPSGLAVAPDRRDHAAEHLMGLVRAKWGPDVANVHRLDADTSGLVLCAKTKIALDFLSGQFQSKTVHKSYQALTVGLPSVARASAVAGAMADKSEGPAAADTFTVDLVIKEDEAKPGVMCIVKKHGQVSQTEFTVLERFPQPAGRPGFAWVECRPLTGRMHQIRIHLASVGTPILNDGLYGTPVPLLLSDLKRGYKGRADEKPLLARLALHAGGLTFTHPLSREKMTLTAPLAKDLEVALKYLRKFARPAGRR